MSEIENSLLPSLVDFGNECFNMDARERAFSGWISHFLMKRHGARRVVVESHHDKQAIASVLSTHYLTDAKEWFWSEDQTRGAFNFDIVVAHSDQFDPMGYSHHGIDGRAYSQLTPSEKAQVAAARLHSLKLIVELKRLEDFSGFVRQANRLIDGVVRKKESKKGTKKNEVESFAMDFVRLSASRMMVGKYFGRDSAPPAAFVITLLDADSLRNVQGQIRSLLVNFCKTKLDRVHELDFPEIIVVAKDEEPVIAS
jgi:hypothetical protein